MGISMFSTDIPINDYINRKLFSGSCTILSFSCLLKSLLSRKWRWLYYADSVYTRKMVPIAGRASSFLVFLEFSKTKQRGGGTKQKQQIINLLKVITFSRDYKYTTLPQSLSYTISIYQHYIYIHTYIYELL